MKELFQIVGVILFGVIGLGLLLTVGFWAMANIWLLLGIFATLIGLLIIYGMATSDNEWVSSLTNLTLTAIVGVVLYAMFA